MVKKGPLTNLKKNKKIKIKKSIYFVGIYNEEGLWIMGTKNVGHIFVFLVFPGFKETKFSRSQDCISIFEWKLY